MPTITVPTPPEGFSSWVDAYKKKKEELDTFRKEHPDCNNWDSPYRKEYNDLKHEELDYKYRAEDENKLAKKAALEAQASEAGLGPKEMKVVNTLERYKKSIDKFLTVSGPKAVKNGDLSEEGLDGIRRFVDDSLKFVDAVWNELKERDEYEYKFLKRTAESYLGKTYSTLGTPYDIDSYVSKDDSRSLWSIKPDVEAAVRGYCENLDNRYEARCMDIRIANRAQKKESKEQHYQRIRSKFYEIKQGTISTMEVFMDDWKEKYIEYFMDSRRREHYRQKFEFAVKQRMEYKDAMESSDRTWRSWSDREYDILKAKEDEARLEYHPFARTRDDVERDANIEAEEMERKFITAVYDYSGEIESVELFIDLGQRLGGTATGVDGRKWNIQTIVAEGPIQRRHLRTLVHEIR